MHYKQIKNDQNWEQGDLKVAQKASSLKDNRSSTAIQRMQIDALQNRGTVQKKANSTSLPDNLKSGIENLSGQSVDDLDVQYNSSQSIQLTRKTATVAGGVAGGIVGGIGGGLLALAAGLLAGGVAGGVASGALLGGAVLGGIGLLAGAAMGGLTSSEVNTPFKSLNPSGKKNVRIQLFYSQDSGIITLGHYTILVTEGKTITRFHFVMKGEANPAIRKIKQFTGTGEGAPLKDNITNKRESDNSKTKDKYGTSVRPLEKTWMVDHKHASNMLQFMKGTAKKSSYGYIIYGKNVDNCGSMALKALAAAGISIQLLRGDQLHQFPSMIRDEVRR